MPHPDLTRTRDAAPFRREGIYSCTPFLPFTLLCSCFASASDYGIEPGESLSSMNKRIEPAQEQLVSILRTAKNGLQYLTQNDWVLLVDRAKLAVVKKGSTLIQQGKQTRMVYLLVKGRVTIESSGVKIAQIGPGQICGEMAFLEDTLASATATVGEEVEAYALSWSALNDLFELFPHLASRFYRSLAVNLSRRLREQITSKGVVPATR
jgi:CRP/FNR family cyclic AMP-dependent transcriptional regulator